MFCTSQGKCNIFLKELKKKRGKYLTSQNKKENSEKEEKIKGMQLQINRQTENLQLLYSENDRKIKEANQKILNVEK